MGSLVVRGHRIVLPDGVFPASLHVRDGIIARIGSYDDPPAIDADDIDAGDLVVMPGLVDTPMPMRRLQSPDRETLDKALQPEDLAMGCVFLASLPARTYVPELIIMPPALQVVGQAMA